MPWLLRGPSLLHNKADSTAWRFRVGMAVEGRLAEPPIARPKADAAYFMQIRFLHHPRT
jgi:hypothetical protein